MNYQRPVIFENGRIIDPSTDLDSDQFRVLVKEGMIHLVSNNESVPEDSLIYDVRGKWVVPGLIDMHVHLREPGQEYKETIETGTLAAAAGGFTAVACMPNTIPPNDSAAITRFIIDKAVSASFCKVLPVAAITVGQQGKELTEFGDLIDAGAVAFSDDGLPVSNPAVMRLALEYSLNFDALIISHAEESALSANGCMNEGVISTILGLHGIPNAAEDIAVFRDIALAGLTGARLHIAHVSTKGAVEAIRKAKTEGIRVTAETAPHYFSLTDDAVGEYNTLAKMNPPLRSEEDRKAIIKGIVDGTIDVIATDHAPHSTMDKDVEFSRAANGIIGLETALPLTLELVRQKSITPLDMIKLMSTAPAEILHLERGLSGSKADLTILDPEKEWEVSRETICSNALNTPFIGKKMRGRALLTMSNGIIRFDRLSSAG